MGLCTKKKKINFRTPLKSIRIHIPATLPSPPRSRKVRSWPRARDRVRTVATRGRYARPLSSSTEEPWCPCAQFAARGRPNSKAATKLKISNRRRQRRRRRRDELFGAAAAAADASRAPQRNDGTPSQGTPWIEADEFQRAVLRWQNERSSSAGGPS